MRSPRTVRTRNVVVAGTLVVAGFAGGAALAAGGVADAESRLSRTSGSNEDRGRETPLTGATAAKVRAAALAEYPGATVDRLETDTDGVYEAHLTTRAGDHVTVEVDGDFTVTGTESSPGRGDHRGHHDETPLTGATAAKVRAAVLAKYPGATVDRLETDADGVYEAHIVTRTGDHLLVQVGEDFKVTGTRSFAGHGRGHHGRGPDHEGRGPGYHDGELRGDRPTDLGGQV